MIPFEQPLAGANRFFGSGLQGQRHEHFVLVPAGNRRLRAIGRFLANTYATAERKQEDDAIPTSFRDAEGIDAEDSCAAAGCCHYR